MNKLIEVISIIVASLLILVVICIPFGAALLFLGWIWLGVQSVWGMIF